MEKFLTELQQQSEMAEILAGKIEDGKAYMEELKEFLPSLNQTVMSIFDMIQAPGHPLEIDSGFVLQVLNDIIYGTEKEDAVFLADVLRNGLLEIFNYVAAELRGEEIA